MLWSFITNVFNTLGRILKEVLPLFLYGRVKEKEGYLERVIDDCDSQKNARADVRNIHHQLDTDDDFAEWVRDKSERKQ